MKEGRLVEGRVIATVEETSDEKTEGEERSLDNRFQRNGRSVYCSVAECTAPPLKMVSRHLRQFHKFGDNVAPH